MSTIVGAPDTDAPNEQSPLSPRPIEDVVPQDPWFILRLVLMSVYGVLYIWWFLTRGVIIDRISVAFSLFIFLFAAFVGRPWRRWLWLLVEVALYALMWGAYEKTRGNADGSHDWLGIHVRRFPLQVNAWRNVDKFLFFGHDPSDVLTRHFYDPGVNHWYDQVASTTYYTHFIFPVIAMAALWAGSQIQWRRFMKRFASLLFVACIMFVLLPSAPPWMVSRKPYFLFPPVGYHTGSGFASLGFKGFVHNFAQARSWGNSIAAMPSLHCAFALIVPAFFLPWIKPKWLKALLLCFPLIMLTSLVYFGEHWVIDGIIGWAIVGGSFLFWGWIEQRGRDKRAALARFALAELA